MAELFELPILYESDQVVACIKPIGVSAQSTDRADGVPDRLAQARHTAIYPLHRLDMAVGGVLLLAKTKQAAATLTAAMQNGACRKQYLCVVDGILPTPTGQLRDLLLHDRRTNRTFVVDRMRKGVKEAVLTYTVLQVNQAHKKSLLSVTLQTGRTHQIRVQFASRGFPLCGDGKYGSRVRGEIALWSFRMSLNTPLLPHSLCTPPPPTDFWNLFSIDWNQIS